VDDPVFDPWGFEAEVLAGNIGGRLKDRPEARDSSRRHAGDVDALEDERWDGSIAPAPLFALAVTVLLALSSVVYNEPAPSDLLFPPILAIALVTGHMLSPLRMPGIFLGSMALFLLANYGSLISAWEWDVGYSWYYLAVTFYMLAYFVFFAGFVGRFGGRGIRILCDGYLLAAMLTASIGVLAAFHVLPNSEMFFRDGAMMRIKSTFKDPNVFAPFLVGAILLGLSVLVHARRVQVRYLIVVAFSLAGVMLAFSRGAWVHLVASLSVYLVLEVFVVRAPQVKRRLVGGLTIVSPLLIGGLVVLVLSTDLGSYLVDRLAYQAYDNERFGNQRFALELADRSLFGIGPGQYTFPRFPLDIHNLYLRVLVENGLIGLLALLAFLASSVFYGLAGVFRRGPYVGMYTASVAVIIGILVESMVIDTLHWRHFFFFLSIPVGLSMFERSLTAEPATETSSLP